jgi:transcriptional regulator of acetoin/glycerol metabolism
LKQSQGNISQAAQELGITRTSLYRRMEKYDL